MCFLWPFAKFYQPMQQTYRKAVPITLILTRNLAGWSSTMDFSLLVFDCNRLDVQRYCLHLYVLEPNHTSVNEVLVALILMAKRKFEFK